MIAEKIARWPFGLGALIVAGIWLYRRALRDEREADLRREGWVVEQLAEVLAGQGPYDRALVRAALAGDGGSAPRPEIAEVRAWIDASGLRATLTYDRAGRDARESLAIETALDRRTVTRTLFWDELPAAVRERFLAGDSRPIASWRAPWTALEARR
jgi:hypothetical protein